MIAALVATVAIVSTGYTAQRLDLNDGSVWVANGSSQVIGRANTQVLELNTVVASTGANIEVIQRGSTVLLFDHSNSKVDIVDAATSKVLDSVPLPPQDPLLSLAGDNVVIGSGGTGEFWIVPLTELTNFHAESQPTLSLGASSVASMTPDGMLFVYSSDTKQVYRIDAAHSDTVAQTSKASIGGSGAKVTITSIGGHWVLLDSVGRTLLTENGTTDLRDRISTTDNPVLQQAATDGTTVLVGYAGGLLRIPVGGGAVTSVVTGQAGTAAAPVVTGGCELAAWSGGLAWRKCGSSDAAQLPLRSMPIAATALAFVANGDQVVLNDPRGGGTWAVQQNGELIDNWSDLITVPDKQQEVVQQNEDTPPNYEKNQLPPVAVNDSFGARPGRSSVLPLLLNDYDPNGDVLVISDVTAIDATVGHLDLINNSQQVQLTLTPSARGTVSFGYSITDGRGGTAQATVTVAVRLPSENSPPQQVRQSKASVTEGGRVTTEALTSDWVDPDGDAFYLATATTPAPDAVSYRPEGNVVFTENGGPGALRSVAVVMSDGRAEGTGSLAVTVKARGQLPIFPGAYVSFAYAGQVQTLNPLDHVRGGTGTLRLVSVPAKTGVTITASLEKGTFRFLSDQIGTHYIDYVVTDGDKTATGTVRIDVAAPPDANTRPITIPKTVYVQSLSSKTIDVAASDIDPAGGVLLLTGVYNVPTNAGVQAEALEQRSIRVTLTGPLAPGGVGFNYRISNGLAQAEGVVTVIEIPRPARLQPPIANDDLVTVRVGDVIDIPVLDNDVQPDGEALTLNPLLSTTLSGDSGLLFTSGNVLRYLAPQKTGDFTAIYSISDPSGQTAQAQVKISVREAVQATNNPPVPTTVIARVLAGEKVRIPIPLTGIDPDGDSVQFLGQATNPQKGSVIDVGPDYIDYQAGGYSAGTDSFTYTVIDSLGARATGAIRVGISPKMDGARNPVAVEDEVTMRPGGTVSVQPLANDSDPDGGTLKITKVEPNSKDIVAKVEGDLVKITPPRQPGRYGLVYTIENSFGGTSSNFITVVVATDAPRAYPVVTDTVLTLTDILGRDSMDVNVLKNVFFADGEVNTLKVSLLPGYSSSATVTSGKRIHVTIENKSQIIPFAVANPDDASIVSYAFVWVPGLDDALPQVNRKAPPLTISSESALTINLDDYVVAIGGKSVRLTGTANVQATHSNGDDLVINSHTLRFTSADKYFGPASISFEVTDGTSATDPNGRTATLVLPITVTARANQPPVFVGGQIDFEPGQSKELDLVKLTNYPYLKDIGELAYSVLTPLPQDFTYSVSGQTLTLRANENAQKGSTSAITLGVKDALASGQSGRIQLNVVASSRPLARPAADSVLAPRGQTTTVDVLANDEATNPFPGKPLRVVAIRGLDGSSLPDGLGITPSADNRRLTVTASSAAVPGDTTLQYQVADATGDPNRYVWGAITVSVQDKPAAVTAVQLASFGNKTLTVRWTPGQSNNSPITGYDALVYSPSLELLNTVSCAATICDIATSGNGPDNGVRIRVVAKNALGSSSPTGLGSTVWSDVIPSAPTGVNAAPKDGGLEISWNPVTTGSGGSPVTSYRVTAGTVTTDVAASSCSNSNCDVVVNGLSNGQQVAVSVSARNSAIAQLAVWNSTETSGIPAGPPIASGAPTATATDSTIDVSWAGVFTDNGRQVSGYTAVAYTGTAPACEAMNPPGSVIRSTGTATQATFTGLSNEASYSVMVFATNSQGCGASAAVAAHTSPGVVSGITAAGPTRGGSTFDYSFTGASIGGTALTGDYRFYYRYIGVPSSEFGPVAFGDLLVGGGQQYGHNVSVQVRACRSYAGTGQICQSNWSNSFALGTPVNPRVGTVSFVSAGNVLNADGTFSWLQRPAGYENVQYSCGSDPTFFDMNATLTCDAAVPLSGSPQLRIRVIANGGKSYDITYDQAGNVQ
ncbi:Ig-like domain-containing protein [Glaciihabitans sp. UYNi722]|uniref:Ig-like domain-containing protein n=1 Tax=Glaciihabitans sp. UYNi722 TaxID=3156344 RepID=UPI003391C726